MPRILIVDDDVAGGRTLQLHLSAQEHEVVLANSVDEGLSAAASLEPELIILDIRMPGRSGLEGLPDFKANHPSARVIMITAFHDMESTIEAMQKGAEDYIHKPIDIDELDAAINKIMQRNGDDNQYISAAEVRSGPLTMVGRSRAMKEVFKTIGLVAKNPATVLITGESGTGKELVARAIHRSGEHPDGPFVAVNCAALVENLLESDMFGHEKGAFTGAVSRQPGKFALAQDGTIFLDEIGELSQSMQAKLLRVLQYKEFTPLGAKEVKTTNARVVAATNVDLSAKVANGGFREDLYYRLQVVTIHLPPLRERADDITDLVQTLLGRINKELNRDVDHISKDVLRCLEEYHWPGNVRELENMLMKAVALCHGDTLTLDLVPPEMVCHVPEPEALDTSLLSLEEMERLHVANILKKVDWHRGKACEILGISRPRLRRMIEQFGLQPPVGSADD
ncbi:MAG: sigma-54 dependent transcriptional regulator [Candidatus Sedimenticola sp. 6PFRAG5]